MNKTYGSIDILVNNAVYLSGQYPEEVSDKDLAYSFDGIIGSVYKCIREVIPYMRGQKVWKYCEHRFYVRCGGS